MTASELLHAKLKILMSSGQPSKEADALLQQCTDAECYECGKIVCPHGEWLHFHHDGCPACDIPLRDRCNLCDDPECSGDHPG
jgi:hypothetical protein